uniref:Uncharacterized protein n=2 Tax=Lactuca TaxID=4235 RepID=A0A9R1W374_LACSA|nr:hypothetical protein LSAT_V11C300136940 [Lactuca sativa]
MIYEIHNMNLYITYRISLFVLFSFSIKANQISPKFMKFFLTGFPAGLLNVLMESKAGKKKSSSSKSLFYEAPLGYGIEDVRPNGGLKKFKSAAYSNCARKPS